jgi:hypothetical protein
MPGRVALVREGVWRGVMNHVLHVAAPPTTGELERHQRQHQRNADSWLVDGQPAASIRPGKSS